MMQDHSQFSHSVVSESLQPCESQHAGLPVHQLPQSTQTHIHWVGVAIQPSHCLSSILLLPSIRVFSIESTLPIRGQSIGVSVSISVLPMNTQDWSPLGWTGWISLQSKGLQESSPTPQFKSINSLAFFIVQLSHAYMTTRKTIALTRRTSVDKMSQLFNMLSRRS